MKTEVFSGKVFPGNLKLSGGLAVYDFLISLKKLSLAVVFPGN
jgi:hypothetical protein